MLNHFVESGATGDVEALVEDDLAQLARLPSALVPDIPIARTQARVATLRGDRDRAISLLRTCLEGPKFMFKQERDYNRYALGLLLGGNKGAQLLASARAALAKCGITDPDANMRAYVSQLMR